MTETLLDKVATFPAETPDWEVANSLNAPDQNLPTKRVNVSVADARSIYMANGSWGTIVDLAGDRAADTTLRRLCILTRDSCTLLSEFGTQDPDIYAKSKAAIDGLLAFGVIDQATHDAIVAKADAPASWVDLNNNGTSVTARDVGLARGAVA